MAHGHVKWFSPFDTTEIPLAPKTVLSSPGFWAVFLVSVEFIYFMVYVDASLHAVQRNTSALRDRLLKRLPPDFFYQALILTLIIFMSCIWAIGDFILTPELKHESIFVATIQVSILAALMTKHTAKIAGAGIFVLWIYAINEYGWFHMADYIIFLGIALFLIIGSKNTKNHVSSSAFLILYLSISWTLQWASVEKWAYPHWSYPLLEMKPYLSMGFQNEMIMVMAGFVEFTLAFLLVVLSGVGFVITAVVLALFFLLAIIAFGKTDAIGHLAIIACLFLMAIKGPCRINLWFAALDNDPAIRAIKVSAIFCGSLLFFVTLYYGLYTLSTCCLAT